MIRGIEAAQREAKRRWPGNTILCQITRRGVCEVWKVRTVLRTVLVEDGSQQPMLYAKRRMGHGPTWAVAFDNAQRSMENDEARRVLQAISMPEDMTRAAVLRAFNLDGYDTEDE